MSDTLFQAALKTKLASIATGSDKRADIAVQQAPDALDQTQFATERDLAVSLINRESELARRVERALRRIQDGTYGVCLACENGISEKRLQAVPWAELCLACQERSDRKLPGFELIFTNFAPFSPPQFPPHVLLKAPITVARAHIGAPLGRHSFCLI
jgi:DnaK suppressor protein